MALGFDGNMGYSVGRAMARKKNMPASSARASMKGIESLVGKDYP